MTDLQTVADKLAIRELIERYGTGVLRRDPALWGSTWAENGRWSLAGMEAQGREAIVKLWVELMANYPFVAQFYNGAELSIAGDRAQGTWNLLEVTRAADGTEASMVSSYDDTYVRCADGQWRIATRSWTLHFPKPADA